MKKSGGGNACFEMIEAKAAVVRRVCERYTVQHLSIGAITRSLNEQAVVTRIGDSRWERSTVWVMLRNPAYIGKVCFGTTARKARQPVTRRGAGAAATQPVWGPPAAPAGGMDRDSRPRAH